MKKISKINPTILEIAPILKHRNIDSIHIHDLTYFVKSDDYYYILDKVNKSYVCVSREEIEFMALNLGVAL